MSFIPVIGTAPIFILLILELFWQDHVYQGTFLLLYGILIGTIDNVLRSFLIRSNIHPAILFLAIFGGLATFGAIGILIGPLLMAFLTATIRIYYRDFIDVKNR